MKFILPFSLVVFFLFVPDVDAQNRGIGVSPAKIEVGNNVEWPYTVPLLVTNFSSERELFEVTVEKGEGTEVSFNPGRFTLESNQTGRVLVTFEKPEQGLSGMIRIAATRVLPEGLTTGTGVKIPFFLASAAESTGRFSQIFGAFLIFATLLLLWQLSNIVEPWVWHSTKR